jgi:hypothetical protein
MSVKEVIGIVIYGLLAGVGFATLFVHFMAGGCIPS